MKAPKVSVTVDTSTLKPDVIAVTIGRNYLKFEQHEEDNSGNSVLLLLKALKQVNGIRLVDTSEHVLELIKQGSLL